MTATAKRGLTTYRWNNNIKSLLLLAAFPLLLTVLLGGIFYMFGWLTLGTDAPISISRVGSDATGPFASFGITPILGTEGPGDLAISAVFAWWPTMFGLAAIWLVIGYFLNDRIIRMTTGAKPIERAQEPVLYNLLENLCISRGLRTPKLYIIEAVGMNAYASGVDQRSYAITVTRGLLNGLSHDELEAVLGHELSHIMGRDCRLLIVTVLFTGMISFLTQLVWRILVQGAASRLGRSRKGGFLVLLMMLVAGIMLAIGYLFALVLRFAISRSREYQADAGSVELTKNPDAMISALRKISNHAKIAHIPTEVRQMFIENPPSISDFGGLFATHPPIAKRIQMLEQLGGRAL